MAKQTFTTGQVLTAAQMTSLQQTAMGGGSATAKTTSYVLVAADAGGTVAMNAAGATTITVNSALFAAGDTVFIQNLGAGATTITAGTATVSTAGSLILPQYDAGILYFTATGASIFYDYIQAGAASPLTTKGDLYTFSTSDARLAVGTNTYVLTADSSEATGLKWAAAAGAGLALVNATNFTTASSVTVDNVFTSTYENYRIILKLNTVSTAMAVKFNYRASGTSNTSSNYNYAAYKNLFASASLTSYDTGASTSYFYIGEASGTFTGNYDVISPQSATKKFINGLAVQSAAGYGHQGFFNATTSFDGFEITLSSGNISGTVYIYGYAK